MRESAHTNVWVTAMWWGVLSGYSADLSLQTMRPATTVNTYHRDADLEFSKVNTLVKKFSQPLFIGKCGW
jgi:hypothetical protein